LLESGIGTEHGIYPSVTDKMAGKIVIHTERCKGCGLCVTACPKNCIVISTYSNRSGYFPAEFSSNDCTGCTACAVICPDAIIEVYRDSPAAVGAGEKNEARTTEEKV